MQTFGDFLGFNPRTHILVTDGCFYGNKGMFRYKVLKMLLNKGKIMQEIVTMLSSWRHTGFNVFCGNRISPTDETAMENLARYIIRASFSQERMNYLDQEGTVVYRSKRGETTKSFPAMEWLAAVYPPQSVPTARTSPCRSL
jgi:hypothetical protein